MDRRNTSRTAHSANFLPPEPPPSRPWYRTDKGVAAILVGVIFLGILLVGIFGIQALMGNGSSGDSTNQVAGTQPTATPVPTAIPTPTSTPTHTPNGPHPITGAFVGGTQQAFTAAYGQPTMVYNTPNFATTAADGMDALIELSSFTTGQDGQKRVIILGIDPVSGGSLTIAEAQSVVKRIMPPDTKYVKDLTDPYIGVIHIYQSADLATTLPQPAFADSNGGSPWPMGTFSVHCDDPAQPCTIATGV